MKVLKQGWRQIALRLHGQHIDVSTDGTWSVVGFESDLTPDWKVKFCYGKTQSGAWTIARVEVMPWRPNGDEVVPDGGVTMALLRKITIAHVHRFVDMKNEAGGHATARQSPLKPLDRRAPTQQQLRKLLARYTHLINAKDPHPAKTLAAELKQPRSTVRTWILRAKELPVTEAL